MVIDNDDARECQPRWVNDHGRLPRPVFRELLEEVVARNREVLDRLAEWDD